MWLGTRYISNKNMVFDPDLGQGMGGNQIFNDGVWGWGRTMGPIRRAHPYPSILSQNRDKSWLGSTF